MTRTHRVSKNLTLNASIDLFRDDYACLKRAARDLLLVDKNENKIKVCPRSEFCS